MFGEKIKALQTRIESKLAEIEALQNLVETEDRGFTEDESTARAAAIDEINKLKARKTSLEETEALVGQRATPAATPTAAPAPYAATPQAPTAAPVTGGAPVKDADASLLFAKQAHALYVSGGSRYAAGLYAKNVMKDELVARTFELPEEVVAKAAVGVSDTTTTGNAAELVQINQAASAFIDLLRNESIVAGYPGRQMEFGTAGSIVIPRQTGGVSGGWVGEKAAIKVGELAFDDVTLTPKKSGIIVVSTQELLRRSDPSAMMLIRDDLVAGISQTIDTKFVSSDAVSAGVSPAGIQTFDSSSTASTGDTLDQITADLKAAIAAMNANNLPQAGRVWIMNPARKLSLMLIRDGLGTFAFRDELMSGTLLGYPVMESNTVTATVVMLTSSSNIIIASELAPMISMSDDATIEVADDPNGSIDAPANAGSAQSMFQRDLVAIKATTVLDWGARRAQCVEVITSVTW